CRAGHACHFLHHDTSTSTKPTNQLQSRSTSSYPHPLQTSPALPPRDASDTRTGSPTPPPRIPQRSTGPHVAVPPSNIVRRPIPAGQRQDPRSFQIAQLKRRFSPKEVIGDHGTTSLIFALQPSDPDFPFELPRGLECTLHIPADYAQPGSEGGNPSLTVRNVEMGAQWRANVEKGFQSLVDRMGPAGTLLGLMNRLDRELENFLTEKKPEIITIIPNKTPVGRSQSNPAHEQRSANVPPGKDPVILDPPMQYTAEQIQLAALRRGTETRQLESRLQRLAGFETRSMANGPGVVYTIPIAPWKRQDLPFPLRAVSKIKLCVPSSYPLQPCRVELVDVSREAAERVEQGFAKKVMKDAQGTLMGHVNMLAQTMHSLAVVADVEEAKKEETGPMPNIGTLSIHVKANPTNAARPLDDDDDRGHIVVIPRPPEWNIIAHGGNDESDDSDESDYSDTDGTGTGADTDGNAGTENGDPRGTGAGSISTTTTPERGIALSFPQLELYGIELLELTSLSITIKCERCKQTTDMHNLHATAPGNIRDESCKKCALTLRAGYRHEPMHANAARAGYLDLQGCTVVDMLPSAFQPTCAECSTPHPAPGVIAVRGSSSTLAICRECHRRMTFKIPEVKFMLVSNTPSARGTHGGAGAPTRKTPKKENLGITAGQPLPRQGRCTHYSKSYRWFRFSCCSRVFPCDRCHDDASDHPNEHANRMICGFCSREQNYRPEDCGVCRMSVIKKSGKGGFWEGGKGVRDKTRMSRKDPRKYKRRPGGAPRKA
ncbi:MAG: hypothetical protein Q9163_006368, partial [Psora crenata]